ncbi:adhesion G-protein coupled receptor G5-like isoform X1 [Embiotoca jacksoni]|uniref:adhesion G-protein coupled receptor G5-like isoform X1 n=2 Tax=Embiotoca jacksoni TaxID=100190 RepID=UPI0037039190
MARQSWMTWSLFVGLLWISPVSEGKHLKIRDCFIDQKPVIVADNFNGFISATKHWKKMATGGTAPEDSCIVFLRKNTISQMFLQNHQDESEYWPQIEKLSGSYLLYISKWHTMKPVSLYVLFGKQCNNTMLDVTECTFNDTGKDPCHILCVHTKTVCTEATYDESHCENASRVKDRYIINITKTDSNCANCNNPVKQPESVVHLNNTLQTGEEEQVDAAKAVELVNGMSDFAANMNGSSVALSVTEGVTGILVRETEPEDVGIVSFAYTSPNESLNIIDNKDALAGFSRSVTIPKEAFKQAISHNITIPFAALFRFTNLAQDEFNSTLLGNEVLAVEMGTQILNLTDTININFKNMSYDGIPSCQSWDGEGSQPNWTGDGCVTREVEGHITCECSHLTFFAILLTPLNETISASDLNNLTTITQIGCGLSMFFLTIVLFMHFIVRKTKAREVTKIFVHLVSAMLLLNFTFLINNIVAKLQSSVGCVIMAALMHYFMLATFTWFAVQALHLCMQLHAAGRIPISRYILKISVTSWVLPSVVVAIMLITGKYGEQVIYTDDPNNNVVMCWITDNNAHNIVNIGYYALVFIFTFATFVVMLNWLFCLRRTKAGTAQVNQSSKSIVTIMGLCCLLGITWGFAFFAYGPLRIPATYIFTILNSFQGFFLFIYYHYTSSPSEVNPGVNAYSNNSTSTLKTSLEHENPYTIPGHK